MPVTGLVDSASTSTLGNDFCAAPAAADSATVLSTPPDVLQRPAHGPAARPASPAARPCAAGRCRWRWRWQFYLDDLVLVDAGLQPAGLLAAASVDGAAVLSPIRMPRQRPPRLRYAWPPSSTRPLPEIRHMTASTTSGRPPPPCRNRCCANFTAECSFGGAPGMSVMEMSHRGKEFMSIHAEQRCTCCASCWACRRTTRSSFMQGWRDRRERHRPDEPAARPRSADYIDTGEWSKRSIQEAGKILRGQHRGEQPPALHPHPAARAGSSTDAAYVHICANETIGGVDTTSPRVGDIAAGGGRVQQHPRLARSTSRSTA